MSRIYLEDYSSNGTFVNGALVGKGNKKILSNGDKIYMACEKGKFFTHLDPQQPKTGFPSKFNI
jgi:pSer/pThr/pTyr-binding forkhead associated (FHA) protein